MLNRCHSDGLLHKDKTRPVVLENIEKMIHCGDPAYGGAMYFVSKGANKNIVEFANWLAAQMKKNNSVVNELFFKKYVCAAIIFEGVDNMVKRASWYQTGGYKLNIVPYTVAKIFDMIPADKDFNWQGLWQSQTLSAAFLEQTNMVARAVNTFICNSHALVHEIRQQPHRIYKKKKPHDTE